MIELLSESDDLYRTKKKMEEWMENGCRLGWLIDLFQKNVYIYKEFLQMKTQGFDMVLSGEDILPGFELPLNELDD